MALLSSMAAQTALFALLLTAHSTNDDRSVCITWTPQVWIVAGNAVHWFVRNVDWLRYRAIRNVHSCLNSYQRGSSPEFQYMQIFFLCVTLHSTVPNISSMSSKLLQCPRGGIHCKCISIWKIVKMWNFQQTVWLWRSSTWQQKQINDIPKTLTKNCRMISTIPPKKNHQYVKYATDNSFIASVNYLTKKLRFKAFAFHDLTYFTWIVFCQGDHVKPTFTW